MVTVCLLASFSVFFYLVVSFTVSTSAINGLEETYENYPSRVEWDVKHCPLVHSTYLTFGTAATAYFCSNSSELSLNECIGLAQ